MMKRYFIVVTLFFTHMLAFAAIKPVLNIQHWTTQNGTRVYFVRAPELPMLDISFTFAAGSSRDGENYGLAQLTNALLNEGTQQADADTLAQRLENVGAIFSTAVNRDHAQVNLRTLTEPQARQEAIAVYADILTHANFPKDALTRVKQQMLTAIAYEQQDAPTQATQLFYRTLYNQHPYAHAINGTKTSVTPLTRDDVEKFYRRFYVARNGILAMVGDITLGQAKQIAEQLTAQLPQGVAAPALPPPPTLTQSIEKNLRFPTNQTVIRLGQLGINRADPDYFPLIVANHVLGGNGLVSRLSQEIREKRGLSYTAYSYFNPLASKGPFLISLSTRTNKGTTALNTTRTVLREFIKTGPSTQELQEAKQNLIGSFVLRLESNKNILANLVMIGFYQRPLNYLDTFRENIAAVNKAQIITALQKHLQPDNMITVLVQQDDTSTAS